MSNAAAERLAAHPEHAEARVVGDELAGPDGVDVLGRERHADDAQLAAPAVDDARQTCRPSTRWLASANASLDEHLVVAARLDAAARVRR